MADPTPEELAALQEQILAMDVEQFVVSAASTIASLAFAKLERNDLAQAKQAIDALASLLPHVGEDVRGDLQLALTRLQVAFAQSAG